MQTIAVLLTNAARNKPERTESVSLKLSPFQTVSSFSSTSTAITISTATAPLATTTTAKASTLTLCSVPTAVYNSAVQTTTKARALTTTLESGSGQEPKQNKKLCQTGLDRYIQIYRKGSPQHNQTGNQPKINRANASNDSSSNRFALLYDCEVQEQEQKKIKPPSIYIREKTSSALVNKLATIIEEKGNIQEPKVQSDQHS